MPVTITDAPPDPRGNDRFQFRATAGEGHKVGFALSREEAQRRGDVALRHLQAVEVHDPSTFAEAPADDGHRLLIAPDGTFVEATAQTVSALIGAGYREALEDIVPQRTNEQPRQDGLAPKRGPGRPRKQQPTVELTAGPQPDDM